MAHVFISYEKTDKAVADQICQYLEEQGLQCWIAPRNVLAGKEWDVSIIEAIKTAGCMVLVFSSQADASKQVKREITIADSNNVPIIPCRIKNVEPSNLAYFLTLAHWFDAFELSLEHHLPQLLKTITSHVPDLQPRPLGVEPPETPPAKPLPPEKKKGRLWVDTEPKEAAIHFLNLKETFYQGMELETGSYHLEVSADGFETKREWVKLDAGENKKVSILLIKHSISMGVFFGFLAFLLTVVILAVDWGKGRILNLGLSGPISILMGVVIGIFFGKGFIHKVLKP